ncbi:kinetochore-associated Ndc80 complex subunit spc25 [Ascosphaera pollenicola]|nr:kinetochore-associated Ndc80 complex subunit spc25 [Ascosphaera pollenicola]
MGDNRTVPLQYGHLGDVRYLPDEQTWEFSRKIDRRGCMLSRWLDIWVEKLIALPLGPYLTPFDHHDEVFPSSEKQECSAIETPISSHLTADKESVLRKNCPQLAPGLQLLHDLNTPSSVLEHIAATWNPQVSATISVGNTISGYSSRTSLVAGFVSSNLPNVVQIVSPRMRSIEWCARRINIPVMAGGDKAMFAENRGRIYQITFAEPVDEKSTFMAVRYVKSTAVFRPVRHTKPVAPSHADEESPTGLEFEPMRLDANPIVEIPVSSTGEASHADVSFNPWYQQELAVIDSQGNWSIWDISPWLFHRNIWRGRCSKSGSINSEHKDDSFAEKPDAHDAWARIMWVGDVHRLFVFGRRRIVVINLADEVQYHSVDLKFHRGSEWILDVFRSRSHMSDVFILTTLRIVWLSLATDGFAASQIRDEPQIKILLEWYHYRDAEDVSLRLAPLQVGPEFALVLYSQMNPLAQIFRVAYSANDASIPVSVSDPSTLHLPSRGADSERGVGGLDRDVYSTLTFQEVDGSSVDDSLDTSGSLRLIKLLAQRTDNSLVESLYVARTTRDEDYPEYDLFSQPGRVREDRYPLSTRDIGGNFVVQDWYEQPVPLPRHNMISFVKQREDIKFPSITDFSRLYAFLLRDVMISGSEENRMLLENANTSFGNPNDLQALFANATTALTL